MSKAALEMAVFSEMDATQFANSAAGQLKLAGSLPAKKPARVFLETTGGYEQAVLDTLQADGLPKFRVNPLREARRGSEGDLNYRVAMGLFR